MSEPGSQYATNEIKWRQYAMHIDLYKFYIGSLLRINLFYYAVTGAILSYYFANSSQQWTQYGLLLPIVFSIGFCILLFFGIAKLSVSREDVNNLSSDLGLVVVPEMRVLTLFLWVSALMLLFVGVAVGVLYGSVAGAWVHISPGQTLTVNQRWLSVSGLTLDLVGAVLLALGYFVSKVEAVELGVSRVCGESLEENLKLPAVQNLLAQSKKAVGGVVLLAIGFLLQIIGNWPR